MFGKKYILLLSVFMLVSCTSTAEAPQVEVVNVYATPAAQPWLAELYTCAGNMSVALNVNAQAPDIYLRVGEPGNMVSPVYKIDDEEILVVVKGESPIQNLTLQEAQDLFAQQGSPSTQVWVYASDADLQMVFDQLVMKGRSVTSFAKLAAGPGQMSDTLNTEKDAIGILPRHWKAGTVRDVFSAGIVPVLAVTNEDPQAVVLNLVSCLQR